MYAALFVSEGILRLLGARSKVDRGSRLRCCSPVQWQVQGWKFRQHLTPPSLTTMWAQMGSGQTTYMQVAGESAGCLHSGRAAHLCTGVTLVSRCLLVRWTRLLAGASK